MEDDKDIWLDWTEKYIKAIRKFIVGGTLKAKNKLIDYTPESEDLEEHSDETE